MYKTYFHTKNISPTKVNDKTYTCNTLVLKVTYDRKKLALGFFMLKPFGHVVFNSLKTFIQQFGFVIKQFYAAIYLIT